jgi:hypothetical protein
VSGAGDVLVEAMTHVLRRLAETVAAVDGLPMDDPADPVLVVWMPGRDGFTAVRTSRLVEEALRRADS